MFGGSGYAMFAVPLLIGAVMTALRFWMFYAGTSAIRSARMGRIADSDAHLSFDERIAERMRELERETNAANPAPAPVVPQQTSGPTGATRGFGRRHG